MDCVVLTYHSTENSKTNDTKRKWILNEINFSFACYTWKMVGTSFKGANEKLIKKSNAHFSINSWTKIDIDFSTIYCFEWNETFVQMNIKKRETFAWDTIINFNGMRWTKYITRIMRANHLEIFFCLVFISSFEKLTFCSSTLNSCRIFVFFSLQTNRFTSNPIWSWMVCVSGFVVG